MYYRGAYHPIRVTTQHRLHPTRREGVISTKETILARNRIRKHERLTPGMKKPLFSYVAIVYTPFHIEKWFFE